MLTSGAGDGELAGFLGLRALGVSEVVEPIEQLFLRDVVAAPDFERPREDARQHAIALAVEARVDHPRKGHVVVAGEGAHHDEHRRRGDGDVFRRFGVGARQHDQAVAQDDELFPRPHEP